MKKNSVSSKRKRNLIESERCKKILNNVFQNFSNINNSKHCSRNTDKGAVFAERFNRTVRGLLGRRFFEKGDGNWSDVSPTKTKQCINRVYTSIKLTTMQASLKKNDGYVYQNLLNKRKKIKPKFRVNELVRTANLKRLFSKGDTTNWSYNLHKIKEAIFDTISSYRIDSLSEHYNQSLL